ncbi:hypothetical protein D3C87_1095080 [compost metagenome]
MSLRPVRAATTSTPAITAARMPYSSAVTPSSSTRKLRIEAFMTVYSLFRSIDGTACVRMVDAGSAGSILWSARSLRRAWLSATATGLPGMVQAGRVRVGRCRQRHMARRDRLRVRGRIDPIQRCPVIHEHLHCVPLSYKPGFRHGAAGFVACRNLRRHQQNSIHKIGSDGLDFSERPVLFYRSCCVDNHLMFIK